MNAYIIGFIIKLFAAGYIIYLAITNWNSWETFSLVSFLAITLFLIILAIRDLRRITMKKK